MKRLNKLSILNMLFLFIYFILILLNSLKVISYNKIFNLVYLIFLFIITYIFSYKEHKIGIGKKENVKKVIYYLVFILLIYFLSGIIFGYSYNVYSDDIKTVINNIIFIIIPTILEEYFRYYVINHRSNKKIYIILITIILILININYNALLNLKSNKEIYIYIFHDIMPLITKNIALSYITIKYGLRSSITYEIIYMSFSLFVPIIPNLGYYISSIILIIIPLIIISLIKNDVSEKYFVIKKESKLFLVLFYLVIFLILCFNFNFFKYKPVGVISNSMKPGFKRGDLVIYKSIDKKDKIKEKNVIVFNKNNQMTIHRVYQIVIKNDKIYYITKGDNNGSVDSGSITKKEVLGKKVLNIPFIGYPSVIINELLSN